MNPLPQRKRLWHVPPAWVHNGSWFFLTVCCETRGRTQLDDREVFSVMSAAVDYYVATGKWWVDIFLAMPDHWHALAAYRGTNEMTKVLRDWKRFVAKRAGVVWQDGFFDHRLRTRSGAVEKWEYSRWNPVKAGLVGTPEEWPYVWMPEEPAAGRGDGIAGIEWD